MHKTNYAVIPLLLMIVILSGCKESKSQMNVYIFGEDFIEKKIPASEFNDNWEVKFSTFEVTVGEVMAVGEKGDFDINTETYKQDLTKPSADKNGHLLFSRQVPPGPYSLSFILGPIHIKGVATKGDVKKSFDWTFAEKTGYLKCHSIKNAVKNEELNYQITIHGDHIFFDSVISETPKLLFTNIAASDRNNDGIISEEELNQMPIMQYESGNNTTKTMWEFLNLQGRTIGHVNGENHCGEIIKVK